MAAIPMVCLRHPLIRRSALVLLLAAPAAWAGVVPPDVGPLACDPWQTVDTAREDGAPPATPAMPSRLRAHFALVPDAASLQPFARPDMLGVKVSATALRTQAEQLQLSAALQRRTQTELPDGIAPTRVKASTGLVGAAQFEQRLDDSGTSVMRGSAVATLAHLRLDGDWAAADAQSSRAAGPYGKLTVDLARQQTVEGPLSVYTRLTGQWASKNLDPSEKLSLAGPSGVRAFAPGAASADRGWLTQWEARLRLAGSSTAFVFADHGWAELNADPWDNSSAATRTLSGTGIGLRHAMKRWTLETAVTRPASAEPRFTAQLGLRFD